MTHWILRQVLWAVIGWGFFTGVHANPNVPPLDSVLHMEMAWWRDPAGAAKLAGLSNQPFKKFTGPLSLGNTEDVVWIRLHLPALPEENGHWVLLIQPAMLQEAQVFVQSSNGSWQHQALGLAHAFNQRPLGFLNSAYPLTKSAQPRQAYIRLKTVTSAFQVQLLSTTQAHTLDSSMLGSIGVFSGLTLAFTLLSFVCWIITRDLLWGLIGAFDVSTLVLMATQMGLASRYTVPDAEGVMNHVLVIVNCTHIAVLMPLSYQLARRFCSRRWVSWPYLGVLATYPIELLLIWQGHEATALAINNTGALLMSAWALVVGTMFDVEDRLLRWSCRTLYWILGVYVLYYLTPLIIRIPPPAALHFYPAMPSNFITMMFSAVMLMRSTQQAREVREQAQRRLLAERELELSKRQHEETSGLLSMLLHEIRTPLALIQTATRAITGGRATDPAGLHKMTRRIDDAVLNVSGVLERCIELDRLEHDRLSPVVLDLDVAETLRDWLARRPFHDRVQLSAPPQLHAEIDPQLWLSMVANLLQNAVKYSPAESLIPVTLTHSDGHVALTVSNLIGSVGAPDGQRVFQKYYRADAATRISGTGLGLYWVKVLSQRLGGDVIYESTEAITLATVTFRLMLPDHSAQTRVAA